MSFSDLILIAVALSMDAVAVGMTNGMEDPRMGRGKMLLVAAFYGGFQFLMPVFGYYGSAAVSALVEAVAPWLSFAVLVLIGGKAVVGSVGQRQRTLLPSKAALGLGKLLLQAVATSIDALAVGVSLLAEEVSSGLPMPAFFCAAVIGGVTFLLSLAAVSVGKAAGDRFSDKAELVGGIVLILIGVKLLA